MTGAANGQRCWEYLSHRLQEINQLRSEDDEQEPILVSKLNCLQVGAAWGGGGGGVWGGGLWGVIGTASQVRVTVVGLLLVIYACMPQSRRFCKG